LHLRKGLSIPERLGASPICLRLDVLLLRPHNEVVVSSKRRNTVDSADARLARPIHPKVLDSPYIIWYTNFWVRVGAFPNAAGSLPRFLFSPRWERPLCLIAPVQRDESPDWRSGSCLLAIATLASWPGVAHFGVPAVQPRPCRGLTPLFRRTIHVPAQKPSLGFLQKSSFAPMIM
jgi:hypothetical protein